MKFIGFYDYTVILTYMSLISSVYGMTQAIHGDYKEAIFCLAFSGMCDAFDGRVARTKKNRTADEKAFGIQLDSLCDVVCFGVYPALICYLLGLRGVLGLPIVFFYCLCAVIRLGFFNVMEEKRQQTEGGATKIYRGLPVTSIAFLLPLVFWLQFMMSDFAFLVVLHVLLFTVGLFFILDVPIKKPKFKTIIALMAFLAFTVAIISFYTKYKVQDNHDETNLIVEEIIEGINETKAP